ncbi:MAG: metallophosphoesterase [Lachnospiraceae bacterium]|nr:metallophosphoesterase [Lachnospiraceae bacterium]
MDILIWLIVSIIIFFIWVIVFDTSRFTVSAYKFESRKVKKEVRIVFLSDLHCKMYGEGGTFLLEKIKELSPHLVLIGGDMITARPGKETGKVERFIKELGKSFPLVYAYGNHELRLKIYPDTYGDAWEKYTKSLESAGISITENGVFSLEGTGLNVISFSADRRYYKRMKATSMEPSYIEETVGKPDPEAYNILLAHNPVYSETYAEYGADITLCGHLHGGLVRIPVPVSHKKKEEGAHIMRGVFSPKLSLFPKYDAGRFDINGRHVIISRGLGTHSIPVRVFNPGELVVIDLKPTGGV